MTEQASSDAGPLYAIEGTYATSGETERQRQILFSADWNPGTIGHLEALGVGEGWTCLEVGAGAGAVAEWLCQRVGPTGKVVATDIQPGHLAAIKQPNLEVRRHDILTDDLAEGAYDLVHVRCVLEHLSAPEVALRRMAAALKPGGWLLAEEIDHVTGPIVDPNSGTEAVEYYAGFRSLAVRQLAAAGTNLEYSRQVFGQLRRLGLEQAGAEGRTFMDCGGSERARRMQQSAEILRQGRICAGRWTDEDQERSERLHALLDDPNFVYMSLLMLAVWGRRPEA